MVDEAEETMKKREKDQLLVKILGRLYYESQFVLRTANWRP
jgi:hypothetical protein